MAPEYYEGEQVDKRADIYAIGIILYEMLTGDVPFSGTVQSIIGGHLFKDPKPLFETNPSLHPKVNEVVQAAMRKKRDERIGSAIELAHQLKAAIKVVRKASRDLPAASAARQAASSPITPQAEAKLPPSSRSPEHGQTGFTITDNNTNGLGEGEAKSSAELLKRGTQNVAYNTVAMPANEVLPSEMLVKPESSRVAQQEGPAYTTQPLDHQTDPELDEPETFVEMVASMKRELAIGSVIVTLLAIALVAFIIYRSQQSTIRVKPYAPATQGSSLPLFTPEA